MYKRRSLVPYCSEGNAAMMEDFNSSELADYYYVQLPNLHHGVSENKSHLFDIFARLKGEVDSTFTRIDMLNFVTDNNSRYTWDTDLFFEMHNLNLPKWVAKMTDTLNKGDELALFALSDAFNRQIFVFTKTRSKPWTTVEGGVDLSMSDLCLICDIHVIYLGNNNYGKIKMREQQFIFFSSYCL